ncbi:MAG: proline--tRNA ligase [archaeon]
MAEEKKHQLGIQVDKDEDIQKWYTDIIGKTNLIEYTDVSGCYILKPKAQFMWDTIHTAMDVLLAKRGVKNASFPLLIPESLLLKEKEHVEGFAPEVAWVTEGGSTKLSERLAIRPTSETIMYPAYAKWIRSHKDLPLKINQWCSVVRWEFKNPVPFLRSREFHWQEGHTVFATKAEADKETKDILVNVYKRIYEKLLAIPCMVGRKSTKEKFAGADYTNSCEIFLPIGKAIQGCTTHCLGQNFAKAFNITFMDKDQQQKHAWQNSWGFSTRSLGIVIMMHSDSKGLVIPPRIAEHKIIVIPILSKEDNAPVLAYAKEVMKALRTFSPLLDERIDYSVGYKFNDAELNGYPIRIELGKKECAERSLTVIRRDTLEKQQISFVGAKKTIARLLDDIHDAMFTKAKAFLEGSIVEEYQDAEKIALLVKDKKIVKTYFSDSPETDELIKEKTGAKTLNIPFNEKIPAGATCPFSGKPATNIVFVAKSL